MRRVLLVQPSLQPPGGGNGVAAWMLQALVKAHRVCVLSWWPVDVAPINRFFGTTLRQSEFETMVAPKHWRLATDHLPVPAALLRSSLLMRHVRRVSDPFDVIVGAHNECDFGRRGIQYIHYPTYWRPRPKADLRWYHRSPALLNSYYRIVDGIGGVSFDRVKQNVTLANSNWTAARVKQFLGIAAQTVYPPIVGGASDRAWSERETSFLAVGRISPEKEYERAIRVLAMVRQHVPNLRLTIIGTWDRHTQSYMNELERLAESCGGWIAFRRNVSRDTLRELMLSHRYGIHAMREEHFGMAPAEMVRAGMIVWVPRGGGQTEIVGDESRLLYSSEEEAAERIVAVLRSDDEQRRLRDLLRGRGEMLGTERFEEQIRAVVDAFRV